MRKLTVAGLVTATTAALTVPIIGLAGSGSPESSNPFRVPTATADEALPAFDDCDELLDWYVEEALPLVGPWGFGGGPYLAYALDDSSAGMVELSAPLSAQRALGEVTNDADQAVGSSDTGTNVQEAGVDEPDVAKTNGDIVVHLDDGDLIVTDVTGRSPDELSRVELPKRFWGEQLLLIDDRVLVIGQSQQRFGGVVPMGRIAGDSIYPYPGSMNSELVSYSIADPRTPVVTSRQVFEGSLLESRAYDDTVRLVLQSGTPPLDFVSPNRRRTEKEATEANRAIVRESAIDDWIPGVRDDGDRTALFDCDDVRHPRESSGFGTLSVVTFDAASPGDRSTSAITTGGQVAYSSTDRLYVATPVQQRMPVDGWFERRSMVPNRPAKTEVHAFALTPTGTEYVATGVVEGSIADRWSLDEQDGDLRVASALGKSWETTENAVSVLREDGDRLDVIGSVRGLGPREDIQSVRWFDDLAVVVTFRQIDPLYTVDLSDHTRPRVLGELKIPGFSSYLHPIGDDQLLGLGTAATLRGESLGAQIATFDISDLRDPEQVSVIKLGRRTDLNAAWDPRAFTFVGMRGDDRRAMTTVSDWSGGTTILEMLVAPSGELRTGEEWSASYQARILPLPDGRVAFVGNAVRLVD